MDSKSFRRLPIALKTRAIESSSNSWQIMYVEFFSDRSQNIFSSLWKKYENFQNFQKNIKKTKFQKKSKKITQKIFFQNWFWTFVGYFSSSTLWHCAGETSLNIMFWTPDAPRSDLETILMAPDTKSAYPRPSHLIHKRAPKVRKKTENHWFSLIWGSVRFSTLLTCIIQGFYRLWTFRNHPISFCHTKVDFLMD